MAVVHHYLQAADYVVVCLYLVVVVVMGVYLKRRASKSLEAYLVGGRTLPWWMLGASGVMDFWDLTGTMIIVSFLYLLGPRGLFIEFRGGAVLVLVLMMLWTGKWHRRSGCLTGAEWMIYRFGDGPDGRMAQFVRAVAGIAVTVGMIGYLVKGTGLFLSIFLPFTPAECAFVLIVTATMYTMFSGFHGVIATHILQLGIIIAASITIVALSMAQVTSVESLSQLATHVTGNPNWASATPELHTPMPQGYKAYESLVLFATLYISRNLIFGLGTGDDPKYFAARSDADCAKFTLLWTCLMSMRWPMMIGLAVLGLSLVNQLFPSKDITKQAAVLIHSHSPTSEADWSTVISQIAHDPKRSPTELTVELQQLLGEDWQAKLMLVSYYGTVNPEQVMPSVLLHTIPQGLRSLILVSLIASSMAGFGAWVNQSSGFFVRDIYQKYLRPKAPMQELMIATWLFITAMVSAGFLFAFSVKSINDVWAWIIMGIGSGMMVPQLLPLYWSRFNGAGYAVGLAAGLLAAISQRLISPHLPPWLSFLHSEVWSLPILGAIGLIASVTGALVTSPTPEAVLNNFYRTTLPFGWWSPYKQSLPASLRKRVAAEHRRDILAIPFALTFQVVIFLAPMLLVIRSWTSLAICLAIATLAFSGLYWIWLRHIDESDRIVADAASVLGVQEGATRT